MIFPILIFFNRNTRFSHPAPYRNNAPSLSVKHDLLGTIYCRSIRLNWAKILRDTNFFGDDNALLNKISNGPKIMILT